MGLFEFIGRMCEFFEAIGELMRWLAYIYFAGIVSMTILGIIAVVGIGKLLVSRWPAISGFLRSQFGSFSFA